LLRGFPFVTGEKCGQNSMEAMIVSKRGPDYSPFFAMWVDNAELMEKF